MKRKKYLIIPSLLVVGTLAACNTNTAMDTNNRTASPYTNVADNTARDNDGYQRVRNYGNYDNYRNVGDRNIGNNVVGNRNVGNDADLGTNRYRNVGTNRNQNVAYNTSLNHKINKAVKSVKGVEKARTIVYGNNVLVAATTNTDNHRAVEKNIKNVVDNYTNRDVAVVFGEKNYQKLTDISNDMNDGRDMNIDNRIRDSFRDVRNNIRRGVNNIEDSNLDIVPNNR